MPSLVPAILSVSFAFAAINAPHAPAGAAVGGMPQDVPAWRDARAPMPVSLLLPPPKVDIEAARAALIERAPGRCDGAEGKYEAAGRLVRWHRLVSYYDRNRELVLPGGRRDGVPFHSVLFKFDCSVFGDNVVSMFVLLTGQHGYFVLPFATPFVRYDGPPVLGMSAGRHLPNALYDPVTSIIEASIDHGDRFGSWEGTWRMIGDLPLLVRYRVSEAGGPMVTIYEAEPWPDPRQ